MSKEAPAAQTTTVQSIIGVRGKWQNAKSADILDCTAQEDIKRLQQQKGRKEATGGKTLGPNCGESMKVVASGKSDCQVLSKTGKDNLVVRCFKLLGQNIT
jgi:hypothetical protein